MTRLSCIASALTKVRLWLSVLACNLGSLWRRLARCPMLGKIAAPVPPAGQYKAF